MGLDLQKATDGRGPCAVGSLADSLRTIDWQPPTRCVYVALRSRWYAGGVPSWPKAHASTEATASGQSPSAQKLAVDRWVKARCVEVEVVVRSTAG